MAAHPELSSPPGGAGRKHPTEALLQALRETWAETHRWRPSRPRTRSAKTESVTDPESDTRHHVAMPYGSAKSFDELPDRILALLTEQRRGVMTTTAPDGSPHAVPVVFALVGDELISPIDHKPKSGQVMKRVRNLEHDDRITLLIDHWEEDWTKLAWLMVRGRAVLDADGPDSLMRALNERYEQYAKDERHDALIRIRPERLSWWAWTEPA